MRTTAFIIIKSIVRVFRELKSIKKLSSGVLLIQINSVHNAAVNV